MIEMRTMIAWMALLTMLLSMAPLGNAQAADINPIRFVMPNGLTVLVQEQHSLPIVQIHALVKAGAAHDPPDKAGLANLVAGLLDERDDHSIVAPNCGADRIRRWSAAS